MAIAMVAVSIHRFARYTAGCGDERNCVTNHAIIVQMNVGESIRNERDKEDREREREKERREERQRQKERKRERQSERDAIYLM